MPKPAAPKPSAHILQELPAGGWTCETCGWAWKRNPGKWGCPSVPRYAWETAPKHLRTTKQLRAERLKPGAAPRGCIRIEDGWCYLYDRAEAVPVREISEAQRAALAKARERARLVHCPGCKQDVDREFFDHRKGLCWTCIDIDARIRLENRQEEARDGAVAWARDRLAEGDGCVVLDTETTALDKPEIIEIAVIGLDGKELFHQRIRPADEISSGALAVHGITREMLAGCPIFTEVYPSLAELLTGKTVVSYNAGFDESALNYTCQRHGYKPLELRWQCAMEAYAEYFGEWSNYFGSFKWQPLWGGDHTALGDCRAALERVQRMAADRLSSEVDSLSNTSKMVNE
jgi:DNA polymerase-3 subunit epsilon